MRELRLVMMTKIQDVGWLLPDTDPFEGIADISRQCTEGDPDYTAGYSHVYKLEAFHRAAHWPEVTDMIEKIMGRPIMPTQTRLHVSGSPNIPSTRPPCTRILSTSRAISKR